MLVLTVIVVQKGEMTRSGFACFTVRHPEEFDLLVGSTFSIFPTPHTTSLSGRHPYIIPHYFSRLRFAAPDRHSSAQNP